jgi:xanthine dehydrogenase molybdopterin-binding subunit B
MQPKTTPEVGGMGHSMKRKEDPRFIRGKGNYVDDIVLPDMLWMDIVRSPFAHAKIKSINAEKAMKVPGVLAVITGETLAKYNLHWMPTLMSDTQMVLPTDHVVYQPQEVAVVLAAFLSRLAGFERRAGVAAGQTAVLYAFIGAFHFVFRKRFLSITILMAHANAHIPSICLMNCCRSPTEVCKKWRSASDN